MSALNKPEYRQRQPLKIGGDPREARLVALAVQLGAEHERNAAILSNRISARSPGVPREVSRKQAMPSRRSLPCSAAACRRRAGAHRNCLFLATDDEELLTALAVSTLWREGVVDPVMPPARPAHIYAQQVMALALQLGGLARPDLDGWLGHVADL